MKAISLWQPWASLMALDEKKIETRSWATHYRGPLAIHAAKKPVVRIFTSLLMALRRVGVYDVPDLPLGAIVGVCDLIDCIQMTAFNLPDETEVQLGHYEPGRFMWIVENMVSIDPIPFRGWQRIFNVPDDILPDITRNISKIPEHLRLF